MESLSNKPGFPSLKRRTSYFFFLTAFFLALVAFFAAFFFLVGTGIHLQSWLSGEISGAQLARKESSCIELTASFRVASFIIT